MLNDQTPIEDQGQEGACSAFALNGAQMVRDYIVSGSYLVGSKQQFYRCETAHDGDPGQDNGSTITTSAWVYKNVGIAPESMYPYSEPLAQAVPTNVLTAATKDESLIDTQLDAADENTTIANMKAALANLYPVRLGFTVYESFMDTGSDGNMPAPSGAVAGGHAVCSIGYDDNHTGNYDGSTGAFYFRNSWGTDWGNNGHFWMPYTYFSNTDDGVGDVWSLVSENDFPNPAPTVITAATGPAVGVMPNGNAALATVGSDKQMYLTQEMGGAWGAWTSLGGVCTGPPAVAVLPGVRMDIFVRGSDSAVYQKVYTNNAWSGWYDLGGVVNADAPEISAYWASSELLLVSVMGSDGFIYEKVWNGTGWSSWQGIGRIL
jgi:hypothetical protein